MKTETTPWRTVRIPWFFLVLAWAILPVRAQTSHMVEATTNVFSPDHLTIATGDTVIWINIEGNHNVNGTQGTFPSNPESFGNAVGAGWTFIHVFTLPGTYDYQCDPHYFWGMTGQIVVEGEATGMVLPEAHPDILLFPNPARDHFFLQSDRGLESVTLMSMNGQKIRQFDFSGELRIDFSLKSVPPGVYLAEIVTSDHHRTLRSLIKQ